MLPQLVSAGVWMDTVPHLRKAARFHQVVNKTVSKVWTFRSSSGRGSYETLRFTDGTTSCNCPGWTRRIDAQGHRSCKHTRLVDQDRADMECESSHDYAQPVAIAASVSTLRKDEAKRAGVAFGMGSRKLSQ